MVASRIKRGPTKTNGPGTQPRAVFKIPRPEESSYFFFFAPAFEVAFFALPLLAPFFVALFID
jgi:hypothetical protein